MTGSAWLSSMLDFSGLQARNSNPIRRTRKSDIARLSYVDSVKLEQYRAWLKARVTMAERSLPAAK